MTQFLSQKYKSGDNEYNIKPDSYPAIQSYLHSKEDVLWVDYDEPYITFAVETERERVKKVTREARELLKNDEISRYVVSKTEDF